MLGKGVGIGPSGDERGMGGLGCDNGSIEVGCGDGIKKEGIGEGEDAFIIMGASIMVWAVREGVSTIGGSWLVDEVNVIVAKGEDITGETAVDLLRAAVVLEILMVGEHVNDELSSQQ